YQLTIRSSYYRMIATHDAHIYTEPVRDSVNCDPYPRTNRCKRVTQHMWADPGNALGLHVITRCAPKVEPVTMASVRHIRLQHERRAQTPAFQKLDELIGQRDRARCTVFRPERFCCVDFNGACREIKPAKHSLDDLHLAHSGMKAAEQDKAQIVVRGIVNQPLCQLKI